MATPLPESALTLLRYRTAAPAPRARVQLPHHMFTFLLEGEKVVQFAGVRVTVRPSHLVLLGAGNCLMSEKAATPGGGYHSLLLLFDPALLLDFFSRHAAWLGRPAAAPTTGQPLLLLEADEFLRAYVQSLDCLLPRGSRYNGAKNYAKPRWLLLLAPVVGRTSNLRPKATLS